MPWTQLTPVENDPGSFDNKFSLDYFARIKSEAIPSVLDHEVVAIDR